jgi:hypothetical protein
MNGTGSSEAERLAERFDPFHEPYLADPYPFFGEARAATPVFYSPDLEYWVVTRYHDMRQIFQTPQVFSAANTLAPLQPICPAAGHLLTEGGFRPVPTLTNSDPPGHTRVRRLANVAFTPRRVTAMEPLIRELTALHHGKPDSRNRRQRRRGQGEPEGLPGEASVQGHPSLRCRTSATDAGGQHRSVSTMGIWPVLILSGNGIEHGLLSLACLHVGVPFVLVSTAYSLLSTDFARLRDIAAVVRPGLIFADDGGRYAAAIRACAPEDAEVVIVQGDPGRSATPFDVLLATTPTSAVKSAVGAVHSGTVANISTMASRYRARSKRRPATCVRSRRSCT